MWKQWINFILGILVVIIAYTSVSVTWLTVLGIIIAILALWTAMGRRRM